MFYWPVRVYYEDTDSGGVVYYANFLKFMERARTEWLRSFGVEQDELRVRQGIIFAVRSVSLEFLRPGRFNDLLQVGVALVERRAASLRFSQTVLRAAGPEDSDPEPRELLCAGEVQVACLDAVRLRPRRIPDALILEVERGP
jgi:acyl-CoA thioester hydrolase